MNYYVCPKCGCSTFVGSQIIRVDVRVTFPNEYPIFSGDLYEDDGSAIYDVETPVGPFICENCCTVFANEKELKAGGDNHDFP